jgi:hypothetical protein
MYVVLSTFQLAIPNLGKKRLTMRAADGGWAARFLSVFVALDFFRFEGESTPTHRS